MTSRCRAYDTGETSGSSTLDLGGQALTNPRVSTSTTVGWAGEPSRSRPSDLQVRSRRFADELPESGDSYSQMCSRRSADELLESADSQSQKGPSTDSPLHRQNPSKVRWAKLWLWYWLLLFLNSLR